jgi:CheY-specific phosphatase CheX
MDMNEAAALCSKVLVLDDDEAIHPLTKAFCDENGLVPVKTTDENPLSVLRSNVDLGAILLWENFNHRPGRGIVIARQIHGVRPELPIFLRRDASTKLDGIDEGDHRLFRAVYTAKKMDRLRDAIGESLFSRVYPTPLVRGITEVTRAALEGQFKYLSVEHDAPCLVKDRIIYGQLFSMIPLESSWCRGYMMLQTEEQPLLKFMSCNTFGHVAEEIDFRELNNLLGEATNMVWGAFKNRFIVDAPDTTRLTQVPIIVNHQHRYISFGSEDLLLCVKYRLFDKRDASRGHIVLYQWFAFSLSWSPDKFKENLPSVDSLFDSGELELF